MNSLLKISKKVGRFGVAALVVASIAAMSSMSAHAAEKDKKSSITSSDFQLTLSNKVYNGDPQSKFVRQSCEPGRHAKVSARKTKTAQKKRSSK